MSSKTKKNIKALNVLKESGLTEWMDSVKKDLEKNLKDTIYTEKKKQSAKKKKLALGLSLGAAAAAGSYAAVSYIVTQKLVNLALDRKKISSLSTKALVSGSTSGQDFSTIRNECSEKLEALELEKFEIISFDGLKLAAHWYPCEGAERTVIAMHGWRSSWSREFGVISDFFHSEKCNLLIPDQRAQGESEGDHMGFGILERHDVMSWIRFLNSMDSERKPVYLYGVSMGATSVMMTANMDLPANVRGIIADCGFTSIDSIWSHVVRSNIHLPYGRIKSALADYMCRKKIGESSKTNSTTSALSESKVPVLFIHGSADTFVPAEMTYENYLHCSSKRFLLIIPGAGHGKSYLTDSKKYEETLIGFWKEFDREKRESQSDAVSETE